MRKAAIWGFHANRSAKKSLWFFMGYPYPQDCQPHGSLLKEPYYFQLLSQVPMNWGPACGEERARNRNAVGCPKSGGVVRPSLFMFLLPHTWLVSMDRTGQSLWDGTLGSGSASKRPQQVSLIFQPCIRDWSGFWSMGRKLLALTDIDVCPSLSREIGAGEQELSWGRWHCSPGLTCLSRFTSCSSSTSRALALNSPRLEDELRPLPGRSQSSLYICRCSSSFRKSSMSCGEKGLLVEAEVWVSPGPQPGNPPPAWPPAPSGTQGGSAAACPSCACTDPSHP